MYWAIQRIANVIEVNASSNGSFVRGFIFEMILLHRDVDSNCLVVVLSNYMQQLQQVVKMNKLSKLMLSSNMTIVSQILFSKFTNGYSNNVDHLYNPLGHITPSGLSQRRSECESPQYCWGVALYMRWIAPQLHPLYPCNHIAQQCMGKKAICSVYGRRPYWFSRSLQAILLQAMVTSYIQIQLDIESWFAFI